MHLFTMCTFTIDTTLIFLCILISKKFMMSILNLQFATIRLYNGILYVYILQW